MSQDTTTVDTAIDPETREQINTSVDADEHLREYINTTEELNEHPDTPDSTEREPLDEYNLEYDADLSQTTARIKKLEYNNTTPESDPDTITITLKTRTGETFTDSLDAALPSDESAEWTRLCNWLDADPSTPSSLRNKIAPTTFTDEPRSRTIDVPPINKRLNPYAYKTKRAVKTLTSKLFTQLNIDAKHSEDLFFSILIFIIASLSTLGVVTITDTVTEPFTIPETILSGVALLLLIVAALAWVCLLVFTVLVASDVTKILVQKTITTSSTVKQALFPQ